MISLNPLMPLEVPVSAYQGIQSQEFLSHNLYAAYELNQETYTIV